VALLFFLIPRADSYVVSGEGNGDKAASDAAGAELSRLAPAEIEALLAETKATVSRDKSVAGLSRKCSLITGEQG
jgi:hypothetical protein